MSHALIAQNAVIAAGQIIDDNIRHGEQRAQLPVGELLRLDQLKVQPFSAQFLKAGQDVPRALEGLSRRRMNDDGLLTGRNARVNALGIERVEAKKKRRKIQRTVRRAVGNDIRKQRIDAFLVQLWANAVGIRNITKVFLRVCPVTLRILQIVCFFP